MLCKYTKISILHEITESIKMTANPEKSGFFKKYFTYDNEYISGTTYFNRLILWIFLSVFLLLPGLYWIGIIAFKRGKSLGWNNLTCYITSILLALSPIILISIPIHFVLWFSSGEEKN
jgi:hypothetical protein